MNPERTNITVGAPAMGSADGNLAGSDASLDAKQPVMGGGPSRSDGYMPATDSSGAAAAISGPHGEVETTASQENLSAKFKAPNVSQDRVAEDLTARPGSSI